MKNGIFTERLINIENHMKEPIWGIMIAFLHIFSGTSRSLQKIFSFDAIYDYLCDIFEEVHSDEE